MNKIVLSGLSLGLLLGVSGAFAADEVFPEQNFEPQHQNAQAIHKAENQAKRQRISPQTFDERLGLTAEQKAKAKAIRAEGREKLKPIMKEMKELRKKADEIRTENMKEFEDILTPEQKAKLKSMKADRPKKGKLPRPEK